MGYGFDNIGDVLSLPPILMEKYMAAAEEIADRIGILHHGRLRFLGTVARLQQELSSEHTSLESLFLQLTDGADGFPSEGHGLHATPNGRAAVRSPQPEPPR